jgi:regulator of PEP synthase PpsR (kinase-PPPase family)
MKTFHLHLVSDATGETVTSVARACLVQFEGVQPIQHNWWLVRTQGQVERTIAGIEDNPGPVLFTLVDTGVRGLLEEACRQRQIPCISLLDPVMAGLSAFLGVEVKALPGRQYQLDAEYFRRIDAMQFTLAHDDGQLIEMVENADIVLVGVSRTSKTPTCMYLANRGLKCANYPLVPGVTLPAELERAKKPLVVGLTRDPKSLSDIRRARLRLLNQEEEADYAQFERVKDEIQQARRIFTRLGWPVVDVTRRSIEEASAAIVQLHSQHLSRVEEAQAQAQAQAQASQGEP